MRGISEYLRPVCRSSNGVRLVRAIVALSQMATVTKPSLGN